MSKNASDNLPTHTDIENWLISYVSQLLEIEPIKIDTQVSFNEYGLDSSAAIVLTGDLQEFIGSELDPTLLFDYPTIDALANYIVKIE
ncbi:acyl carrier protein [Aphanothece sacrum]|uniref:Long-chain-fatty-acid CoA ligase n=1 Tax=Aphanothece sacrum FPU1 TaxID=1920663 RepID=A0A401IH77_APHSA|nr:acyl carrier protein [Aphanothece sacrum]GBF80594.1 long-chain-fatty-acid CoA ligase [Aphanothece sacrum FPU1]GBF84016.1 long chain fatty acid CoA ligase [Aphanothece sacrum FPU3]